MTRMLSKVGVLSVLAGLTLCVGIASAEVIDKQAKVTAVAGSSKAFKVGNGDKVQFAKFTPTADDPAVGISKTLKYNSFMITNKSGQAHIVWSPDQPVWQDKLSKTNTVVRGLGVGVANEIMRGDVCRVSVQAAQGGGTDVTLDVFRNNKAVATFSFVVK